LPTSGTARHFLKSKKTGLPEASASAKDAPKSHCQFTVPISIDACPEEATNKPTSEMKRENGSFHLVVGLRAPNYS